MATIPTIVELYERIAQNLRDKLSISDDELKKVVDAFAAVTAAELKIMYLFLGDIQNNVFPDTADTEENGGTLNRHGEIQLNRFLNPATNGVFQIQVTGVDGSVLRSGLTFKSNDDSLNPGRLYILDLEQIIAANNDIFEIRSLGGGTDFSLEVGNTLTITEPVIGVEKVVTIESIIEQPLSSESIDSYRKSIIDSIQLEPQGGAKTDYRLWGADTQGVLATYPYVKDGEPGTVQIYVEATEDDSIDGNGTPTQQLLDDVYDVVQFDPDITKPLNERGRRPIQANIETVAVLPNPVDVTITGLSTNTIDIQNSIEDNIKETLKSIRPFVAGGDLARNKNDILYAARLQSVVTDILDASNGFTTFSVFINGSTQDSFLFSRENIPYLRNLTINE